MKKMSKKKKSKKMKATSPDAMPEAMPMKPTMHMKEEDMPEIKKMKHGQKVTMKVKGTVKELSSMYSPKGQMRMTMEIDKVAFAKKLKEVKALGED